MESYIAIGIAISLCLAFYKAYEAGIYPARLLHIASLIALALLIIGIIEFGAILLILCGLGYIMLLR